MASVLFLQYAHIPQSRVSFISSSVNLFEANAVKRVAVHISGKYLPVALLVGQRF